MSNNNFNLKRTKQCAKCPWKKSTNPYDIPDGYELEKHKNLSCTISKEGDLSSLGKNTMHVMACHHSKEGNEEHCIGWVHNQLGPGNNIMLRLQMRNCDNIQDLKVYGPQHDKFEDTLPG